MLSPKIITTKLIAPHMAARDMLAIARDTLHEAQSKALQLLAATRKELASNAWRMRKRARRVGFSAGRKVGQAELQKFLDFESVYARTIHAAERDCVELSVALASEIIGQDLAPNTDLLLERIKRAIGSLLEQRIIRISVNPSAVSDVTFGMHGIRGLEVVGDDLIATGNAVIDTASGRLELDWRAHLESLRQRLLNKVHNEQQSSTEESVS